MNRRSPTLEGFAAMVRQPSFGAAEIAWRWSFGFAAAFLLTFSFVQYLDTLPVTARDIFFLRTGQSALVSQALARIFQGSTPRLILATLILVPALALAWAILGAIGRAATLRELVRYFRTGAEHETAGTPVRSIFGLNFLRLAATLAAAVGCFGAVLLAGMASSPKNPAPGSALLIFLMLFMLVSLAWATINWFLSLSAVFVVSGQQDTFGALSAAANLCRTRSGSVFAAGTWFGLAHLTAFVVATSIVAFPLAFLGFLPTGIVLGGVLVVTLIYFAVTDFLYVGRLAAYVAIVELPIPVDTPAPSIQHSALSMQPRTTIDKDELILCDALMSTQHSALSIPNSDSIDKDETILSDYSQPDSPDQAKR
jgi:hypothetical protein